MHKDYHCTYAKIQKPGALSILVVSLHTREYPTMKKELPADNNETVNQALFDKMADELIDAYESKIARRI